MMTAPAPTYEDLDQVGPHVKCAATIERLSSAGLERSEVVGCRLNPSDGHTVHRSEGDWIVWSRVERPVR